MSTKVNNKPRSRPGRSGFRATVVPLMLAGWVLIAGCTGDEQRPMADPTVEAADSSVTAPVVAIVEERYLTLRDEEDNVDSVATWHGASEEHWLLATAKSTDALIAYDAVSGEKRSRYGMPGDAAGQFSRPNGIFIIDALVFVIERDNTRVQVLSLPALESLGAFGAEDLIKPYGGWVRGNGDGRYSVFVTDSYETADEQIPPHEELDKRVVEYEVIVSESQLQARLVRRFGATSGDGVLTKVESLFGDAIHDRLLIADEHESRKNIKIYSMDGRFSGTLMGDGVFRYEPEGIALYACGEGEGIWFTTDQGKEQNLFHLFDRATLSHLASFAGRTTLNTDGVWLTRQAMPGFPHGAFFAVHDDGNVAAFDLLEIFSAVNLSACETDDRSVETRQAGG